MKSAEMLIQGLDPVLFLSQFWNYLCPDLIFLCKDTLSFIVVVVTYSQKSFLIDTEHNIIFTSLGKQCGLMRKSLGFIWNQTDLAPSFISYMNLSKMMYIMC